VECSQQTNELAISGAQHYLSLELQYPNDWAAGIHDNVAMSGACSVCLLTLLLLGSNCLQNLHQH